MEILTIDVIPVPAMLDSLKTLVKADGSNNGKRLHDLQVIGIGEYEAFDVYYPLLFPVTNGEIVVEALNPESNKRIRITETAVSRSQRAERLATRYSDWKIVSDDDLWRFELLDAQTAYLRLGTFVTWKMQLDWKNFLKESFTQIMRAKIPNLILDICGNEGGADEVNGKLVKYIVLKHIELKGRRELLRYKTVPPALNQYLDTWDDSFRDCGGQVVEENNGFYTWRNASASDQTIRPGQDA